MSTATGRNVVGQGEHLRMGVRRCHSQCATAQQGQIGPVVTHGRRLMPRFAQDVENVLRCGHLVGDIKARVMNSQRQQALTQGLCVASCNHCRNDAGALQQNQPVAVQHVEPFECFALFGEIQGTVRHDSVHIEKNHAQVLRLQQQLGRKVQVRHHQITLARIKSLLLSAPHNRPCRSTTSTLVMR